MFKRWPGITYGLACLLCGLLVLAIYSPGLPGDFLFDDLSSIVANESLRLHDLSISSLLQAMFSGPSGTLQRPLSMLSFALNVYFSGLSPLAFKLTNIFVHLGCGILLGFLAREILRAYAQTTQRGLSSRAIAWLSLSIAALWLVHPLNLTTVLYSVQRENSLAAAGTVAAILAYMVGRRRQREGGAGHVYIWLWTPSFMFAGMLCKENAALTPVYLLVIEFTLLGFGSGNRSVRRELLAFYGIFLLLPVLAFCAMVALKPDYFFSYAGRDFTLYQRVLSECRILLDYLRWALVPDPRQLGLFHDDIPASRGLLEPWTTLASCLGIAALLAAAFRFRKQLPLLSLGVLWFFAGHLMESTILPLELVYEHRNYLPLFGLILGTMGTLYPLLQEHGQEKPMWVFLAMLVLMLAGVTAMRAADWRTELSFARSESSHHPDSPRALAELEWAYVNYIVTTRDASLVPAAEAVAQRSKAADRHSINQDIALAYMFTKLGDAAHAKRYLSSAAQAAVTADSSATLQLAVQTLLAMATPENSALYPNMRQVFTGVFSNPRLVRNDCYTGVLWNSFAIFQEQTGDIPSALGAMHDAVTLCPRDAQVRANFARILLRFGDVHDAKEQLDKLRELHDIHLAPELRELQQQYDQKVTPHAGR